MHALLHGLHAWHVTKAEMQRVEQIQSTYLKKILELPPSTPTAAMYMELGIWPVRERLEYLTCMLYQDLARRKKGVAAQLIQCTEMELVPNFIVQRAKNVITSINEVQTDPRSKNKQEWSKVLKKGLTKKIVARLKEEMKDKTKFVIYKSLNSPK